MRIKTVLKQNKIVPILLALSLCAVSLVSYAAVVSTLTGYAWSSTTGWIQMSGTATDASAYGVDLEDTNELTGYAWSSSLGWLKFGGLTGCPSGSCDARLNVTTGELEGWARFCSATEGTVSGAPFDVTYSGEEFVLSPYIIEDNNRVITFSSDGMRMFAHTKTGTFYVYHFELAVPYDIASAVLAQTSDPVGVGLGARIGMKFSPDGMKFFVSDWDNTIHEFLLSSAYDLDTAVWNQSADLTAYTTRFYEFEFINGGTGLVLAGSFPNSYMSYFTLGSAYDISSVTYVNQADYGISGEIIGLEFSPDGSQLFIIDDPNILRSYALSTPYDVTTATFVEQTSVSAYVGDFWSLHIHDGGTKMTGFVRSGPDRAVTFDLGQPWDLLGNTTAAAGDCSSTVDPNAGDWDGWVSLNCANTGQCGTSNYKWETVSGSVTGFAWGGDVVGWVAADSVNLGILPPSVTFEYRVTGSGNPWSSVSPVNQLPGEEIEFQWTSTDATSCSGLVTGSGAPPAGDFQVSSPNDSDLDITEPPVGTEANYTLLCDGLGGQTTRTITIDALAVEVELDIRPQLTPTGGVIELIWNVNGNDFTTCSITGPDGYNFALTGASGIETFTGVEGESNFTLSCPPNGAYPGDTETARVNITSTLIES